MMSADPYLQAPTNLKTFNRYGYVWNNPLKMYDPEGYFSYSVGGPSDPPGSGSTYTYTNSDGSQSNYGCTSCGSSSPGSSSYQAPAGNVSASIPTRPNAAPIMGQPIPYSYQKVSWWEKGWRFFKDDVLKLVDGIPPGKLLIGAAAAIRNADKLSDVAKALEKGAAVGDDAIRASLRAAEQAAKVLTETGEVRYSLSVAEKYAETRPYLTPLTVTETIAGGVRVPDPQGVAGRFMYTVDTVYNNSVGKLEVLVNEISHTVEHAVFKSSKR
jgi:hypothetical protein